MVLLCVYYIYSFKLRKGKKWSHLSFFYFLEKFLNLLLFCFLGCCLGDLRVGGGMCTNSQCLLCFNALVWIKWLHVLGQRSCPCPTLAISNWETCNCILYISTLTFFFFSNLNTSVNKIIGPTSRMLQF